MVFAAGLGTRLRPYTNDRPKALVEVQGKTLLEIVLLRLKSFGIKEVVVNVHRYADMVIRFLNEHEHFGMKIVISDERGLLLDTGGGLLKAKAHLEDAPFLSHNVDILSVESSDTGHCAARIEAHVNKRVRVHHSQQSIQNRVLF